MKPWHPEHLHRSRRHFRNLRIGTFRQGITVLILLLAQVPAVAIANAFPAEREYANQVLALRGEGRASYLFWDIYDAALYLPQGTKPDEILAPTTTRCLAIHYLRDIKASDLRESSQHVLKRLLTANQWQVLRPKIRALNDRYQSVRPGDRYLLCYAPESGTSLFFNNKEVINIRGGQFARAYFGIWLDKQDPIAPELRRAIVNDP